MGLTITNKRQISAGNMNMVLALVSFDSSYPTGGEALTPGNLGLASIEEIFINAKNGYIFEYDKANKKLKAFAPSGAASGVATIPVTDVADTSGDKALFVREEAAGPPVVPARLVAALTGDSANITITLTGTGAAAGEVGNTTDLSALENVPILAIGY